MIVGEHNRAATATDASFSLAPQDYRIQHQPSPEDHRLSDLPDDAYGSDAIQFYGAGQPGEVETVAIFKKAQGNPDSKVTLYRVVPDFVDSINPGDWVTVSKKAADEMNNADFLGVDKQGKQQKSKIVTKEVKVSEVGHALKPLLLNMNMIDRSDMEPQSLERAQMLKQ